MHPICQSFGCSLVMVYAVLAPGLEGARYKFWIMKGKLAPTTQSLKLILKWVKSRRYWRFHHHQGTSQDQGKAEQMTHIESPPPPPLPPALSELARSATACKVVGIATYQNRFSLVESESRLHAYKYSLIWCTPHWVRGDWSPPCSLPLTCQS